MLGSLADGYNYSAPLIYRAVQESCRRSPSFSIPSCFLTQPSIQACLCMPSRVICICPASPPRVSHMCWPSVGCTCGRFSHRRRSACDFPDKGTGVVSPRAPTTPRVCDHTLGQRAGGWVRPPEHGWLQLRVCLFAVGFSPFISSRSVSACIDLHPTYLSKPGQSGKRLPSATATMWKVSEQILSLTQLSLHWSDLHRRGRGDLNSQCTTLICQVKWGKESKVSECPCCLQAAEPSSLSLPRLVKNLFPSQHTIPFIRSCSPLTGKRKLVSLCHHVQESDGHYGQKPHQRT